MGGDDDVGAAGAHRGDRAGRSIHSRHAGILRSVAEGTHRSRRIQSGDAPVVLAHAEFNGLCAGTDLRRCRQHRDGAAAGLALLRHAGDYSAALSNGSDDAGDRIHLGDPLVAGGEAVLAVCTGAGERNLRCRRHAHAQRQSLAGKSDRGRVFVDRHLHRAHDAVVGGDGDGGGAGCHTGHVARRIHLGILGAGGFEGKFRVAVAGDLHQIQHIEFLVSAQLVSACGEVNVLLRRRAQHLYHAAVADAGDIGGHGNGRAADVAGIDQALPGDGGHLVVVGGEAVTLALKLRHHSAQLALHASAHFNGFLGNIDGRRRAVHRDGGLCGLAGQIVGVDIDDRLALGDARHHAVCIHGGDGRISTLIGAAPTVATAGKLGRNLRGLADQQFGAGRRCADAAGRGFHRHLAAHTAVLRCGRNRRRTGAHALQVARRSVHGDVLRRGGGKLHRARRAVGIDRLTVAEYHAQRDARVAHADGGAGLADGNGHRLRFGHHDRIRIPACNRLQGIAVVIAADFRVILASLNILFNLATFGGIHRARGSGIDPSLFDAAVIFLLDIVSDLQTIRLRRFRRRARDHVDHARTNPGDLLIIGRIARIHRRICAENFRKARLKRRILGGVLRIVDGRNLFLHQVRRLQALLGKQTGLLRCRCIRCRCIRRRCIRRRRICHRCVRRRRTRRRIVPGRCRFIRFVRHRSIHRRRIFNRRVLRCFRARIDRSLFFFGAGVRLRDRRSRRHLRLRRSRFRNSSNLRCGDRLLSCLAGIGRRQFRGHRGGQHRQADQKSQCTIQLLHFLPPFRVSAALPTSSKEVLMELWLYYITEMLLCKAHFLQI